MNYGNELAKCEPAEQSLQQANLTVAENINLKIAQLQTEIARLEASKQTLAPLLAMKIGDIRKAIKY